jgi:hypothetical protein
LIHMDGHYTLDLLRILFVLDGGEVFGASGGNS